MMHLIMMHLNDILVNHAFVYTVDKLDTVNNVVLNQQTANKFINQLFFYIVDKLDTFGQYT